MCEIDIHIYIIIIIMITAGCFGGYLNYLHNFDTAENDSVDNQAKKKYILLGIGAAILVPAFLKMISSGLIENKKNNIDYLIFAGFCLIAAIFSRRFINTIGERILEAVKKAEKTAQESKEKAESTQKELTSAKEKIEDVRLVVDLNNTQDEPYIQNNNQKDVLLELANSFVSKTSISDYSERLKLKAELGRKMGEIIVRNNLSKQALLLENKTEGLFLALAYSVQLKPNKGDDEILEEISKLATQLYTRYSILNAYDTLARRNFIKEDQIMYILNIINGFQKNADKALLSKIKDTTNILKIANPNLN
ncbi:YEATS-associated helix-containing protein [Flavobacterium sp. H4147]|uniref:YEATS-associated helix-containing protein n=1 Tax=Flavobacterium sp. H4147 TaxID=3034149 RepID=UPI0027D1EE7E|nr:YEATS-associated helix-containing protein [Flavobacterium sp. H4147]